MIYYILTWYRCTDVQSCRGSVYLLIEHQIPTRKDPTAILYFVPSAESHTHFWIDLPRQLSPRRSYTSYKSYASYTSYTSFEWCCNTTLFLIYCACSCIRLIVMCVPFYFLYYHRYNSQVLESSPVHVIRFSHSRSHFSIPAFIAPHAMPAFLLSSVWSLFSIYGGNPILDIGHIPCNITFGLILTNIAVKMIEINKYIIHSTVMLLFF